MKNTLIRQTSLILLFTFTSCDWVDEIFDRHDSHLEDSTSTNLGAQTNSYYNFAIGPYPLFRWTPLPGSQSIDIFVEVADAPSELPLGLNSDSAQNLVVTAINQWKNAIDQDFQVHFAFHSQNEFFNSGETVIRVQYIPDPGNGMAVTRPFVGGFGRMQFVEITYPIRFNLGGASSLNQPLMTHEFGHAFGSMGNGQFSGHSPNHLDVMYGTPSAISLSRGDEATMNELYLKSPQIIRQDNDGTSLLALNQNSSGTHQFSTEFIQGPPGSCGGVHRLNTGD